MTTQRSYQTLSEILAEIRAITQAPVPADAERPAKKFSQLTPRERRAVLGR